ncbi:response regulator, partial [Klebsiella pneumoniae]|uniref:response regulator n=3 Tax=Bacteria TaxID=2 RepID=UPI0039EEFA07
GTVFRIFLPRHFPEVAAVQEAPAASSAVAQAPAPARAPDLTGQGTILLVEDEDGLRSLNARGLRSRGYTVIEAENGLDALEALEREEGAVDLVVSDVVMPE